ncbi:hypothetical protein JCM3770_001499, partial [Rhodotorula araucariae]
MATNGVGIERAYLAAHSDTVLAPEDDVVLAELDIDPATDLESQLAVVVKTQDPVHLLAALFRLSAVQQRTLEHDTSALACALTLIHVLAADLDTKGKGKGKDVGGSRSAADAYRVVAAKAGIKAIGNLFASDQDAQARLEALTSP